MANDHHVQGLGFRDPPQLSHSAGSNPRDAIRCRVNIASRLNQTQSKPTSRPVANSRLEPTYIMPQALEGLCNMKTEPLCVKLANNQNIHEIPFLQAAIFLLFKYSGN